ncbi:MAG TPA: hypothetical protein VGK67_03310 [Myxococcales bacterium]|jgi:hypothetical protein
MRTWKAIALLAAIIAACDDPVGLVPHGDDAGISDLDTGPAAPPDASSLEDVGVPDTGPLPDTGPVPDTGAVEPDAGSPADAAEPVDAGPAPDAGAAPDTGTVWDGGGQPDVGTPPDAAAPGLDASDPGDTGPGAVIGQPCANASACDSDTCLGPAEGWPAAGYCAQSGCSLADPTGTCPAGSRCRDIAQTGTLLMCLDLCTTGGSDPCATGLACAKHGGGSPYYVCEPP